MKRQPSPVVATKKIKASRKLLAMMHLCDQVTLAPLVSRMRVLRSGMDQGSTGVIPAGGHTEPSSIAGESELCK